MPFQCARGPFTSNEEPPLEEMLRDDVLRLVMERDVVSPETLRRLAAQVRKQLREPGRLRSGSQGPHSPTD